MKRALAVLAGISILLAGLSLGYPLVSALAMTNSGSNTNTCEDSYPAPYTGGASVAKFFHLSDGSTVTITATGAVIKQGRCDTAYREGWISTSDICNIQSAQDLNGHLSSGSSNPNGSTGFTGCSTKVQSSSNRPASSSITIVNNNSQSQSQAQSNSAGAAQTTASASSKASNGTSSSQAQVLAAQTSASPVKTLPNTGPGNVILLSGATSAVGTIGHWYYSRRNRRLK